jgi:hypothetical protein
MPTIDGSKISKPPPKSPDGSQALPRTVRQRIRGSLPLWPVLVELLLILGAFCF